MFVGSAGAYKDKNVEPMHFEGDERKGSAGHVAVEKYLVEQAPAPPPPLMLCLSLHGVPADGLVAGRSSMHALHQYANRESVLYKKASTVFARSVYGMICGGLVDEVASAGGPGSDVLHG